MFAAVAPIDLIAVPTDFATLLNLEVVVVAFVDFSVNSSIDIEPSFTDFAMSMTLESTSLNWDINMSKFCDFALSPNLLNSFAKFNVSLLNLGFNSFLKLSKNVENLSVSES